jgi:hypothetical protein
MGTAPENAGRNQGRFCKGRSGNPRGKLKGTRNYATRLAEALLHEDAVDLVRKAIELAKAGDITALRLCLERLIPRRVERAIEFELPSISEPKDAVAALSRITEGVGHGELTAIEAGSLISLLTLRFHQRDCVDLVHGSLAPLLDQRANVFNSPNREVRTEFEGPWEPSSPDACPPGAFGYWNRPIWAEDCPETYETGFRE